jgi:prolyl 4-hydroxylase
VCHAPRPACADATPAGCVIYLVFALHFLSFHFESSKKPYLAKNTPDWSVSDTAEWIKSQGLYAEANLFVSAKVNGAMLLDMTEWDIGEVIGVKDAMTRDALYRNIVRLRSTSALPSKAPIVVGAVPSDAAVLGQKAAQAQAVIKKEPPPPQDIKFYSSGKSFLEDPAHQISRVDLESRYATLDEVKRWLGERVGEPVVTLKGREGVDITDVAMLKSLGQAYFLRKDEFYFLPVEAVGGKLNVYLPSIKREVAVEMLSTTPRLLLVKNFMSKEECDKIIETAKPRLEHSTVAVVEGGKQDSKPDNQVRTSSTAWLNARSTGLKLLDDITERVYELVKVPMDHAEDMQVLHYGYKQHYHAHHDFFDPNMYPTEEYKKGHNRMITVFMYLSDVEEGGETNFPYATGDKYLTSYDKCEMGLKVKPKLGDCIIFYSMKAEAHRSEGNQLDNNSLHAGCDVLKGDKWSANYWIRNVPWRIGTP